MPYTMTCHKDHKEYLTLWDSGDKEHLTPWDSGHNDGLFRVDDEGRNTYTTHDEKAAAAHLKVHRATRGSESMPPGLGRIGHARPESGLAAITQHYDSWGGLVRSKLPTRGNISKDEKALLGAEVALNGGPTWSVWCHMGRDRWALTRGGHDDWEYRDSDYIRRHMVSDRAGQAPLWVTEMTYS